MSGSTYKITGGIYLVLDPSMEKQLLLDKLAAALSAGIDVVQIWNNWPPNTDKLGWIEAVAGLCHFYKVPLLINEDWELLNESPYLDGVHLDIVPEDFGAIKQAINRPFLTGITCSGDLATVTWATAHQLDYVSFCAMFPSPSAGSCSVVMPATVKQAKAQTSLPLFVSGGITPDNLPELKKATPFDGVAVISGILSAGDPREKVKQYQHALGIKKYTS